MNLMAQLKRTNSDMGNDTPFAEDQTPEKQRAEPTKSGSGIVSSVRDRFLAYNAKVNWFVFCFIFVFTIGAWIDINGIWTQLPIMVNELPEGWKLGSVLSVSVQVAQLAPILFLIGRRYAPNVITFTRVIYIILCIGALSCLLLSFFWHRTAFIFNEKRSVGLIVLNFCLAILDGTSSVAFLPYIATNFIKEYIIANYVGESLAALIPSVLSLAQGLGQTPVCSNVTDANNVTTLVPGSIVPNYPVSTYFLLLFALLTVCAISFTLLNFSPVARRNRKRVGAAGGNDDSSRRILPIDGADMESEGSKQSVNKTAINSSSVGVNVQSREKNLLLAYTLGLSFLCYGVIPGLQTYSTLPYGNAVLNYAVNFSFICLPIAIFLSIWSYDVSLTRISVEYAIATSFSIYIIVIAAMSPCPPLLDTWVGPTLTVASWILTQCMFMRCRCLIATRLDKFGEKTLLIYGTFTMVGQIFGGVLIFLIVNIFELLESKPDCVTDNSHCYA